MSRDSIMQPESIAASFSFKPLSLDLSTSTDSYNGEPVSPTEIFRDVVDQDGEMSVPSMHRANPIKEQASRGEQAQAQPQPQAQPPKSSVLQVNADDTCRIISPYPFSHTSQAEIEEREQLSSSSLAWPMQEDDTEVRQANPPSVHVDYSLYFDMEGEPGDHAVMDCDDFTISSHEANSLSEDLCLDTISTDPASFWEEGVGSPKQEQKEDDHPTQISLGSNEP